MLKIAPIGYKRLVCMFEKAGFCYQRTKGDHYIYTRPGIVRPLVIPMYDAVPVFVIKNLLRTACMDREEYFELLEQC